MQIGIEDLKKLIKSRFYGDIKRAKFNGVSIDSRTCKKGDLFFAIKGEKFDGHEYLIDVFKRGAKGAVVNRSWYNKLNTSSKKHFVKFPVIAVKDTVKS